MPVTEPIHTARGWKKSPKIYYWKIWWRRDGTGIKIKTVSERKRLEDISAENTGEITSQEGRCREETELE